MPVAPAEPPARVYIRKRSPMARTLLDKVWEAHTVRTLPSGQTQLLIGLHLIHEVTTPQAFQMLKELKLKVRMPERTFGTIDPAYIRDHIEEVRAGLRHRGLDPDKALEQIATLETARRRLIPEIEALKRQQNTSGDEIARAKRQGKDTTPIQEANRTRAQQIKQLGIQLDATDYQRNEALLTLPNLPHASVPVGKGAEDNVEVRRVGEP